GGRGASACALTCSPPKQCDLQTSTLERACWTMAAQSSGMGAIVDSATAADDVAEAARIEQACAAVNACAKAKMQTSSTEIHCRRRRTYEAPKRLSVNATRPRKPQQGRSAARI